MSSKEVKDAIIDNINSNEAGHGSVLTTYKDARLKDSSITMKFVQGWFAGNVINRKQPTGQRSSFVAPYPGYEYQVDLFFLADLDAQKFTLACLCIDMLRKFALVVPLF